MKKLILVATLALAACNGHNSQWPFVADQAKATDPDVPVILGSGQVLRAPGVTALVGPASVHHDFASIPLFVQDAPPFVGATSYPAVSCLLYDAKRRLIAAKGGIMPPKLHGGSLDIHIERPVATVSCQLGQIPSGDADRG